MTRGIARGLGLVLFALATPVPAATTACRMQLLGPDRVELVLPAQRLPEGLGVRITDPAGNPVAGVAVAMYINLPIEFPEPPPGGYVLPAEGFYGTIEQPLVYPQTGSDGIARKGFTGGTANGTYEIEVTAGTYIGGNAAICGAGSDLERRFVIRQGFGTAAAVPAASTWGLLTLAFGVIGMVGLHRSPRPLASPVRAAASPD